MVFGKKGKQPSSQEAPIGLPQASGSLFARELNPLALRWGR